MRCFSYQPARRTNPKKPVEIKVTAQRFEFEPRTITVQKGQPVKLVITSTDVDHGFAIEELYPLSERSIVLQGDVGLGYAEALRGARVLALGLVTLSPGK